MVAVTGCADLPAESGTATAAGEDGDSSGESGAPTTDSGGTGDGDGDGVGDGDDMGDGDGDSPALPPAIGLVQYNADLHLADPNLNVAALTELSLEAVARGAKIIVHPEGSTWGYADEYTVWCEPGMDTFQGYYCLDISIAAEPLPGGPTTAYWAEFAAEHQVYVVYHIPEVAEDRYYNALGVVGPEGFVTKYRKRSLYIIDQAYASWGEEAVILETEYGDFGLMICLDGSYDGDYYDEYIAQGVDGIILSMDWSEDPDGPFAADSWFTQRAIQNNITIYASDVAAWDGTAKYVPEGTPRARDGFEDPGVDIEGVSIHVLE